MKRKVHIPEKPLDFLDREIEVGQEIVYTTGDTSARLVHARVVAIEDRIDEIKIYTHQSTGNEYTLFECNGLAGPARFRLVVNRLREGAIHPSDRLREIDSDRPVRLTQLHRVVVIK